MENHEKPASPCETDWEDLGNGQEEVTHEFGLTKKEYACIHLGVPETGDEVLDDVIRKARRERVTNQIICAAIARKGNIVDADFNTSLELADELIKQLEGK